MIFAHQGGWDEMLMVAVPIAIFVLLLRLANRRAEAKIAETQDPTDPKPPESSEPESET